jgi:hypothetical protein
MISVVICSVKPELLEKVSANIRDTIGVPHEIIAFDNRGTGKGICTVYNEGWRAARYDIICFSHEDVQHDTPFWGQRLVDHFRDPTIGLIGLAGGGPKPRVPSSWSSHIRRSEVNYIQHFPSTGTSKLSCGTYDEDDPSLLKPVVSVDGFWMCTHRSVVMQHPFDDVNFPGFHGYDMDFSLQVSTTHKVCVAFDILVHHFSEGSFNRAWLESAERIVHKWKKQLPRLIEPLTPDKYYHLHWVNIGVMLDYLFDMGLPLISVIRRFLKYSFNGYFYLPHFLHFCKLILQFKTGKIRRIHEPDRDRDDDGVIARRINRGRMASS